METLAESGDNPESRSDGELVAAVNNGDSDAFEALYRRHRDWVVNLAWRFTRDRELALDVLQETFLYFLKKFPGFRLTANLKTFLYPAVKNLAIGARRKAVRYQSNEEELEFLETGLTSDPVVGENERLALVIADLPELHREVLQLRFVDGLSLGEIGVATGIPLGTVKSRLHHALATLRNDPRTRTFFEE